MTTVAPPPPPSPPTSGSSPTPQLTAILTKMPPVVAKLPPDSLLGGLIKPSSVQGEALLQTPQGPVSFKALFQLPVGAQATFKIIQMQPQPQMQLTQLNGQAIPAQANGQRLGQLGVQLPQTTASFKPAAPITGAAITTTGTVQNTAPTFKAWVISNTTVPLKAAAPQPTLASTQAQNASAPPLGGLQKNITPPQPGGVQTGQTRSGQTGALPSGSLTQNNPAAPQNNATLLKQGNQLSVRLLSVQTPGQTPTQMSPPSATNSTSTVIIQGQVQGQSAQGQSLVKFPQGTLLLDASAKFPENTQIRLEVIAAQKPLSQGINPALKSMAPHGVQDLTAAWPSLEEALHSLKLSHPGLADQFTNQLIPKPDLRLAANVLFFLKALGRGVPVKNWTEETIVKALGRTKPDLLAKLEEDFANLSQKATQPNSTDWKIAYVPLQDQNLHQIRISHREPDETDPEGKEDPGVRFVIDLELSKLGPIQLDGLAKDRHKKFDLIFRTKSALPGFMRHDIHHIFEQGLAAIGFEGKITYQVTPHFINVEATELSSRQLNFGMIV